VKKELVSVRIFKMFLTALGCLLLPLLAAVTAEAAGQWRLDGNADAVLPRNFRSCREEIPVDAAAAEEQDDLCISGSGQPSAAAMPLLYQRLKRDAPVGATIYMVDLRQESHGYVNGRSISWYMLHNWANQGLTAEAVEADEEKRLAALPGQGLTAVPLGKADIQELTAYTAIVHAVMTEREAAEQAGFHYVRFAAADQAWPAPPVVDAFLAFYKNLPAGPVWLHFHCHAGHGRTTTFMILYDILRHPDVPLEAIAARQRQLGGSDILAGSLADNWQAAYANDRAAKLRLFYAYVQAEKAHDFAISWSDWLTSH
jgi:hypothetical protein